MFACTCKHHTASRHVDADCEGFSGKENLDQALRKQNLDNFFKDRQKTSMVNANASVNQFLDTEHLRKLSVRALQTIQCTMEDNMDAVSLRRICKGERLQPRCTFITHLFTESKHNSRQKLLLLEIFYKVQPILTVCVGVETFTFRSSLGLLLLLFLTRRVCASSTFVFSGLIFVNLLKGILGFEVAIFEKLFLCVEYFEKVLTLLTRRPNPMFQRNGAFLSEYYVDLLLLNAAYPACKLYRVRRCCT
mmetsp:Transcript_15896/g.30754  ORF Transcript_15896/g.30754 Transcript_15896/m.30754 type:complete len:248 (+) Transcript_15896:1695-2438(+)